MTFLGASYWPGFGGGTPAPTPTPTPTWGPDAITNGSFASGSDWTLGGAKPPTISAGALRGDSSGTGAAEQDLSALSNTVAYALDIVVSSISTGSITITLSANNMMLSDGSTSITAPGTYALYGVKSSAGNILSINLFATDAVIDSVVMRHPTTLGPELVAGGDFASSAGWTLNLNGQISGGTFNAAATAGNRNCTQNRAVAGAAGELFAATYTISGYSAGTGNLLLNGSTVAGGSGFANGTVVADCMQTSAGAPIGLRMGGNAAMAMDDFSVKKYVVA